MAKIVIVEDNELNLKLFKDLLEAHGHVTFETRSGHDAIPLIRLRQPDLVLMDIQLPEVSGLEITRQMKADGQLAHIPVIAVTAFAMRDDEEKIMKAGCEGYVSKPISIGPFIELVHKFLATAAQTSTMGDSATSASSHVEKPAGSLK